MRSKTIKKKIDSDLSITDEEELYLKALMEKHNNNLNNVLDLLIKIDRKNNLKKCENNP